MRRNCQSCHAAQPLDGVPMALVTWEDFQQRAVSNASLEVHRLANMRIHDRGAPDAAAAADAVRPKTRPRSSSGWRWAVRRVPAVGAGGTGGAGRQRRQATGGASAAAARRLIRANVTSSWRTLRASKTTPYAVNNEHYVNFYFDAPWPADAQGISFESVFDGHPEIVHHWLLYTTGNGFFPPPQPDGAVESFANGSHFGATLVAGWAPGGNNGVNLPPDVGLDINGQSRKLVMEIHYFANSALTSRSGVKVCTTKTPRPNLATVSWLGTESISVPARAQGTASGTCAPSANQPIHILRSWPHMHRIGTHMKTVINSCGRRLPKSCVDEPFNFNTQISYDTPTTIKPGRHADHDVHLPERRRRRRALRHRHQRRDVLQLRHRLARQSAATRYGDERFREPVHELKCRGRTGGRRSIGTVQSCALGYTTSMALKRAAASDGRTLPDRIADHFIARIFTGELAPGSRLPADRELAPQLGVDRTSLRMAMQQLGRMGLIKALRGSGVTVLDYREHAGLDFLAAVFKNRDLSLGGSFLLEALDDWIEQIPKVAGRALARATRNDLAHAGRDLVAADRALGRQRRLARAGRPGNRSPGHDRAHPREHHADADVQLEPAGANVHGTPLFRGNERSAARESPSEGAAQRDPAARGLRVRRRVGLPRVPEKAHAPIATPAAGASAEPVAPGNGHERPAPQRRQTSEKLGLAHACVRRATPRKRRFGEPPHKQRFGVTR